MNDLTVMKPYIGGEWIDSESQKFTTIYDLVPTVLDMFGFKYYTNLYYGTSIFNQNESILYSRAYDIFLTDKIYFSSLNNIFYKSNMVDKNYINQIETKALKLLEKIDYINQIFYQDYFANTSNYNLYQSNMNLINNK